MKGIFKRFFKWVISHQKTVLVFFSLSVLLSAFLAPLVQVNYNLMDYLPKDSSSVKGLDAMQESYHQNIPSVRVMISKNSLSEAEKLAQDLKNISGVTQVLWLGDVVSTKEPLEFQDPTLIQDYYREGHYLYSIAIASEDQKSTVSEIREVSGEGAVLDGGSVATVFAMNSTEKEVKEITGFVILIVFGILLLTTSSWFEPVLFMVTIGVAILINQGTNLIFGEISFITNAAALILQLAVSMDYAIFLLHRFSEFRHDGLPVKEAMLSALEKSFGSILASASTTVFGFAALLLMRYRIGSDLGLVLGKSVILSLVSVMVLLPVLSMLFSKLIDKTHHKPLTIRFKLISNVVTKVKLPVIALFILLTSIGFLAQNQNEFQYGISKLYIDPTLTVNQEKEAIEEVFGKVNQLVILIEKGDLLTEEETYALTQEVRSLQNVQDVVSYTEATGRALPIEFVPDEDKEMLLRDGYQRMIVTIQTPPEGDLAFQTIQSIESKLDASGISYYLIGETPNTRDLKNVVTSDNLRVNGMAILAIGVILLLTFRNVTMPLLLLLVIESAIFINLGVPYLLDQPLFYISYLIVSAVQLGATVDYAILFGSRYIENRAILDQKSAATMTISDTGLSILTSAGIMAVCGFFLGSGSSNQLIAQLGVLIGRGALISACLVMTILPCLLMIFDKWCMGKHSRHMKE